jgi:hypothetical protein
VTVCGFAQASYLFGVIIRRNRKLTAA